MAVVNAQAYQDVSSNALAASNYADVAVGSIPGGDAFNCATDSCTGIGWGMAIFNLVPGEAAAIGGLKVAGFTLRFAEFSQARNAALRWLEARGFKAIQPVFNRFPVETRGERIIGYSTERNRVGYRIEYDGRSGAHINVYDNDTGEKGHFMFDGTDRTVNSLTNPFNR